MARYAYEMVHVSAVLHIDCSLQARGIHFSLQGETLATSSKRSLKIAFLSRSRIIWRHLMLLVCLVCSVVYHRPAHMLLMSRWIEKQLIPVGHRRCMTPLVLDRPLHRVLNVRIRMGLVIRTVCFEAAETGGSLIVGSPGGVPVVPGYGAVCSGWPRRCPI
jgi:hypothetical protein